MVIHKLSSLTIIYNILLVPTSKDKTIIFCSHNIIFTTFILDDEQTQNLCSCCICEDYRKKDIIITILIEKEA